MNSKSYRTFVGVIAVLVSFFSRVQSACAQETGPTSKEAWVTSYALVILCVGLALFVICRPSRRDKKVKKD